jgi:hypothetical protein
MSYAHTPSFSYNPETFRNTTPFARMDPENLNFLKPRPRNDSFFTLQPMTSISGRPVVRLSRSRFEHSGGPDIVQILRESLPSMSYNTIKDSERYLEV